MAHQEKIRQQEPYSQNQENILRMAKEITVKFIEVGRVTPGNFSSVFENVYSTIRETMESKKQ